MYFTVVMHFGGNFKLVPKAEYTGGLVVKFERQCFNDFNMTCLNLLADQCRMKSHRRFYVKVNKGFILLNDDKTLEKHVK